MKMRLILPPKEKLIITSEDDVAEGRYYSSNPLIRNLYRNRLQYAIDLIENNPESILDIGCGGGVLTLTLQSLSKNVVSMDIHDKLESVNSKIPGKYIQGSIFDMPFKNKFDCILCLSVLEHLEDFEEAIVEITRHLNENGYVLFGIPSDNLLVKFFFWIKNSPALKTHINSKRRLINSVGTHMQVVERRTLRIFGIDYYTVLKCRLH